MGIPSMHALARAAGAPSMHEVKTTLMTRLLFATHNLRLRDSSGTPLPDFDDLLPGVDGEMLVNETTGEVIAGNGPPLRT